MKSAYDVVVVGGGNAALCAALSARERGASVLVAESAPRDFRGGNSRHTRNLRCMHDQPTPYLLETYREDEFFDDLRRVSGAGIDEPLARRAIRNRPRVEPGWAYAACGSRRRSVARCTWAARTCSFSAAARRC